MTDTAIIVRGGPMRLPAVIPAMSPLAGRWLILAALLVAVATGLYGGPRRDRIAAPPGVVIVPTTADRLISAFDRIGYRLDDVRRGLAVVPRIFVKAVPPDLDELSSVAVRKAVFIKTMLPLILRVNDGLRAERARVEALSARVAAGEPVTAADRAWLDAEYVRHGVVRGDAAALLRRIDIVPPSLALAQAAEESGWGTSRFAVEGRALFGQRSHGTEDREAAGLIPAALGADAGFRVRAFGRLLDGVRAYIRNLNSHEAYAGFRARRAEMRRAIGRLNSLGLAEALGAYSERGTAYIDNIKAIIRGNSLRDFDGARLAAPAPAPTSSGA